jgi:uncharacterized repeat protein (TIGR01451 family)
MDTHILRPRPRTVRRLRVFHILRAIGVIAALLCVPAAARAQGAMTNGAIHTAAISLAGELDQWTFSANQGDAITIAIGETGADTAFYPWMRLQAPNGTQIANTWGDVAAQISLYAPQSGTYTLIVASNDSGFNDTGDYRLTLSHNPGAFVVSGGDQGGAMTIGANHAGSIQPGDLDLWSFDAVQGAAITLRIGEVGNDSPFYPWIRIRGPNGAELDNSWGPLAAEVSVYAPSTGTYTVVVASNDSGYDATGDYLLTLALTPGTITVPSGDHGGPMTPGANHAGSIHRGDIDMYSFTAVQGAAITLRIGEVGDDSPFYPYFRLRGPNGTELANSWGPLAAEVSIYAPSSGTYHVIVASNDSGYDATGDYLLTLALTPSTFVVPSGDQGGALVNGLNYAGAIHRGDIDMYSFTAVQGAAITLRIGEVGDDTPFYPYIRLRGPNGTELANSWGPLAAENSVYAPSTGTYTVIVASNDSGYEATGDYLLTLSLTPSPSLPIAVSPGDDGSEMTNGANHAGVIHRGDLDQWTFTATQGAAITLRIGEVGDDSPFYPYIRLRGPNGTELANSWGPLAAEASVVAPSSGVYTVLVATNDSGYEATGNYLLTLALTPGSYVVPSGDEGGTITHNAIDHEGFIHRADLDQWSFTSVQGTRITVSIGEPGTDSPFYPYIRLRGPNGNTLATTWGAVSAQFEVNAPLTGLYTVVVASNDSGYAATGAYRLRVNGIANVPTGGANLQITKAGTFSVDTVTYTLTATNHGQEAAADVVVSDTLPAALTFVSCAAPGGSCGGAGNARTVSYASIAAGASRTITIVATTAPSGWGSIVNTATIAASTADPDASNNTATHVLSEEPDDDGDTMPNTWENNFGLDPNASSGDNGASGDPDNDGIQNSQEFANGTHPRGFFTRFLAEGANNAFFDVRLALLNVGSTPARLLRRYLQANGAPVTQFEILAPGQRRTLTSADLGGLNSPDFSTVVESDQPIVLDRTMTWGGGYGSHAESGVPSPATTWYLAEGSTSGDFALFYLLQNPNETATTATVRYLLPGGAPPIVREYQLAGRSRTTIPVDDQGAELAGTDVSAVISAPLPIIVERAMYRSTSSQVFAAGHGSAGVTAPATNWFLAEGATGPFFDCFILLANPNDTPATATIDYLLSDGATHTKSYEVPANGRFTVWVDDEQIPGGSGLRPLDNVAVSSTVTSNVPIIVERTMWWPSPAMSANFWTESHNSPGATATGTRWALAEGEAGGSNGTETYILIANTSNFAGTAVVTLYFEDGASAQRTFELLPRSRMNVNASADFPESVNRRFGAVIESVGAPAAQIVVERAMYTSPGGVTWTAGTNALGARIQ